jgi:hypothetical protein
VELKLNDLDTKQGVTSAKYTGVYTTWCIPQQRSRNMEELAQQAYHTWLALLYGSKDAALMKGVKPWQNLPEKAQQAWQATVEFIWKEAITEYLRKTSEIQG